MNSKEDLIEAGDMLREQQIRLNDELKRVHAKLAANDALRSENTDLIRQVKEHGRAVRQSVALQNEAEAALNGGNNEEAQKLLSMAAQALPDASSLPVAVASSQRPVSARPRGRTLAPPPAASILEPAQPAPTPVRAPAQPPTPDTSGMEQRLKEHFDLRLGDIRAQVEATALPEGYRAVLEEFTPEDLRTALKAGNWVNSKKRHKSQAPAEEPAKSRKSFFRDDQFSPAQLRRARG